MPAALRKRTLTAESDAMANDATPQQPKISDYELTREKRIRENRERMGKLGIFDLSLSLKLHNNNKPHRTTSRSYSSIKPKTPPTLKPSAPTRRSSRLQNVTPVSYAEVPAKKSEFAERGRVVIEQGAKPEVYTDEHLKLLGNTQKPWTLFVDGCGKDGKRIYDSVRGKTCHQCRQKTLGYRTCCSQCNMVQGQFCGDCLYMRWSLPLASTAVRVLIHKLQNFFDGDGNLLTQSKQLRTDSSCWSYGISANLSRYGEHVLEALQNPTWLCPVCRGICNCSLCRQAKGWAPTGPLYKKISSLGYKSVAHFLVQTRRAEIDVEKNADASNPVSVQRSLPFSDEDKSLEVTDNHLGSLNSLAETEGDGAEVSTKRLLFSNEQEQLEKIECLDTPKSPQLEKKECSDTMKPLASSSKPSSDSIAGRLRSRSKKP
ncbi:cell division cycle-associated 7-like protein isoform X1 [Vigna radiata var. radiata]|uniref:Cell division cycle-associated 7-like protein isoform X1 n=1 Tax=Vigna radiata var. radiata TaxID=3916 RepID=A0A3Q0EHI2_VIGRR|nr:cell division cycle-associated 7-like protein isoform X1 [Vigna radiata var. radiata]